MQRLTSSKTVRHKLIRFPNRQGLEQLARRQSIRNLEVRLQKNLLPLPQPLTKSPHIIRSPRQCTIDPFRRNPASTGYIVPFGDFNDLLESLFVLGVGPDWFNVLVEEED